VGDVVSKKLWVRFLDSRLEAQDTKEVLLNLTQPLQSQAELIFDFTLQVILTARTSW
jgi:hypothetical protein